MPSTLQYPKRVRGSLNAFLNQRVFPEGTGQTFKQWAPLGRSSGKVVTAAAAGANITQAVPSGGLLGVALKDASGTADTDVPVALFDESMEFLYPVNHTTATSAVVTVANVGSNYELQHVSEGNYAVKIDATTSPVVEIVEIDPTYPITEQHNWVWVRFIRTYRDVA